MQINSNFINGPGKDHVTTTCISRSLYSTPLTTDINQATTATTAWIIKEQEQEEDISFLACLSFTQSFSLGSFIYE